MHTPLYFVLENPSRKTLTALGHVFESYGVHGVYESNTSRDLSHALGTFSTPSMHRSWFFSVGPDAKLTAHHPDGATEIVRERLYTLRTPDEVACFICTLYRYLNTL